MSRQSRRNQSRNEEKTHEVMLGGVGSIRSSLAKLASLRAELAKSKGSLWERVVRKAEKSQKRNKPS